MATLRPNWTERPGRWMELATLILVLAGAFAIRLVFLRDPADMFRLPKAMFLRAEAILLAGVTLAGYLLGAPLPRPRRWGPSRPLPPPPFPVFLLPPMYSD